VCHLKGKSENIKVQFGADITSVINSLASSGIKYTLTLDIFCVSSVGRKVGRV